MATSGAGDPRDDSRVPCPGRLLSAVERRGVEEQVVGLVSGCGGIFTAQYALRDAGLTFWFHD